MPRGSGEDEQSHTGTRTPPLMSKRFSSAAESLVAEGRSPSLPLIYEWVKNIVKEMEKLLPVF